MERRYSGIHGIRARRAFADGVVLLGIVNAAAGFLFEWGRVNGVAVKGVALVAAILSHGPQSVLFGSRTPGAGAFLLGLPLAVTLPAMVFPVEKLRPAGRVTPLLYLLCGAWSAGYLLYSAMISGALQGYHGIGFGFSLLGFTLMAVGGALRWPDSTRDRDRLVWQVQRAAASRAGAPPQLAGRALLAALLIPPPVLVLPVPRRTALGAYPPCTLILVAVNLLAFAFLNFRSDFESSIVPALAFSAADANLLTLVTSQFVHFSVLHAGVNMLVLFIIGREIEAAVGWRLMLLFYLGGGAIANLVLGMAAAGENVCCAGASGSIAALLGLMLVMMPGRRIRLWFYQVVAHRTVALRAGLVLSLYLALQTAMALLQSAGAVASRVGYWNHLGGMLYGMAGAFFLREALRGRLPAEDQDAAGLAPALILAAAAIVAGVVHLIAGASAG